MIVKNTIQGKIQKSWTTAKQTDDIHNTKTDYKKTLKVDFHCMSRNFYVRTDVNFNWLYVRKLK